MSALRPWLNLALLALGALPVGTGCALFPEVAHQPVIRNPFPQLSTIAVAEFVNQSGEPTINGRRIAEMYVNELQQFQGFEVLPVSVTMNVVRELHVNLADPDHRRKLCMALGVDAVVIGSITEFTPYYPPRCGLAVNWYAANPCFHPIPPGYGLPFGSDEEEFIPEPLIYEAEFALAKAQMATQTPHPEMLPRVPPMQAPAESIPLPEEELPPGTSPTSSPEDGPRGSRGAADDRGDERMYDDERYDGGMYEGGGYDDRYDNRAPEDESDDSAREARAVAFVETTGTDVAFGSGVATAPGGAMLPPDWPDPRGFVPPGPQAQRPACRPSNEPVLRHTRIYHGNDSDFTTALASYYGFRDDARYGGWQGYLQRSDDFIRFCCHKHIAEMLSARGGADKSRVVYRWRKDR